MSSDQVETDVSNGDKGDGPVRKRMKSSGEIREGILLGYGNPLLDISAPATQEFLDKYELQQDNAILAEDKHKPMYKDMVDTFKDKVEYVPGGATMNAIRVCQWLCKVPNATSFFGCISRDDFGDKLENKAKEDGVNVKFQITNKETTGTCAVLITDDKRSLCANLAAANCFTEEHLDVPENWELVEKAEFYYIAGFPLTVSPPSIMRIAKHAHQKGKKFSTNLSAPFLCQFFKEPMLKCLPYVDVLFGNETEAETFAKENNFNTSDIKEIALKLAALPKENDSPRTVVITQGDKPTVVAYNGETKEYPVIPISQEDLLDTNGAGDAFVGGFLSQWIQDKPIETCIKCGNYAAHTIIQRSGCTFPEKPNFQ